MYRYRHWNVSTNGGYKLMTNGCFDTFIHITLCIITSIYNPFFNLVNNCFDIIFICSDCVGID